MLALKEWKKLDGAIQVQFKKALEKLVENPKIPSAQLRGDLQNTYKIKLHNAGYRLVYEVIVQRLVILMISIGRRDHEDAYISAANRVN